MSKGPLAVRWGAPPHQAVEAGTVVAFPVELENTGAIAWGHGIFASYHWLDDHDNPIVWDGIRTEVPPLEPGAGASLDVRVRAPIPPGRYRLAFDLVAEHRAWFSELGSTMLAEDVDVLPRTGEPTIDVPPGFEAAPERESRIRAAHAEGYAVVAGAVDWNGGLLHRRPKELAPYEPGPGRVPGFSAPLLAPSVLAGVELEPLGEIAGLPAFAAPRDEPWVYDGRIVLRRRP